KRQQFYRFAANRESARDVYSKHRIIAITKLQIIEWHGYKHLDWITVRRYDNKLYTFKEGDFKQLRLQDIEDMLIILIQGKLTNLNVEDCLAFGVSLRMFTRSIVIQRRVEDLQLGIESYQKKLNITKPDMYRSDLERKDAYTAYSYPRGFIYLNKDKKNGLMRIDELHKFSDGTLDDVWTALNDRLKGIRMEYLPKTIWRQNDRERAKAMIQAIKKMLKSRRIMRSLGRFIVEKEGRRINQFKRVLESIMFRGMEARVSGGGSGGGINVVSGGGGGGGFCGGGAGGGGGLLRKNTFGCKFFLWKEERVRLLVGSPGSSSTPIYSSGSSSTPIYSPGSSSTPIYSRNAECSNCKHLLDKITVLEATVDMYMHPEQHTVNSAALFHEVYNNMGKLDLE
ncbi:hypothetical protein Tco_0897840, partial [Tanacetum coccineum]